MTASLHSGWIAVVPDIAWRRSTEPTTALAMPPIVCLASADLANTRYLDTPWVAKAARIVTTPPATITSTSEKPR